MRAPRAAPPSAPSPLATLLVMQFAFGVAFSTFLMLPKILATRLGAGPGGIGVVNAMFSLAGVAAVPFIGARVDRPGRPRLMARGSLLMAVGTLGFVAVDHVGLLAVVLRAAQGVAYTVVFVAGAAFAADLSPPARMGRTMGLFGSANLVTNAIAPAIAEPLLDHVGAGAVYALAAATSLISFALARRLVEPVRLPSGEGATLSAVLRRGRALRIVAVLGLTGIALGTVFSFNQPMALALGVNRLRDFFIAYTVAVLFVRFGLGNLVDRVGPQRATVGALVLYSFVVFSMRFLGSSVFFGLAPLGLAFGVAHGFFFPASMSLSVADLPPAERGRMLALANGAFIGGMALVMPLGVLAARAGYPVVFTLAAAGTLGAAALLARWPIAGPRALP
ncbi:MAG: rane protein major facilitator superfamily [Myxococcales bacterium]|nr:rane protein major facilitator superfamily [Myxococcales bacterium]